MRTIFASILAALSLIMLAVLPAAASPMPWATSAPVPHRLPCTVTITDSLKGVTTTGSFVHNGEVIRVEQELPNGWFGKVPYVITHITDKSGPYIITLSPSLPKSDRGNLVIGYC